MINLFLISGFSPAKAGVALADNLLFFSAQRIELAVASCSSLKRLLAGGRAERLDSALVFREEIPVKQTRGELHE